MNKIDLDKNWHLIEKKIKANPGSAEYRTEWCESREKYYERVRYIEPDNEEIEKLRSMKDRYIGNRIFIIGNGPSLNRMPLELLKSEYTFATNRFYLMFPKISWRPNFYTVCDWRVAADVGEEIDQVEGTHKFYPERFRGLLKHDADVTWYCHSPGVGSEREFSLDATNGIRGAGSVTGSAIQLAFHMGFDPIYLVGCDASYTIPESVNSSGEDKFGNGIGYRLESTADDDPNHFDSRYFGKGKESNDPQLHKTIFAYEKAKTFLEDNGREITNLTKGGKLEVFQRDDYDDIFK